MPPEVEVLQPDGSNDTPPLEVETAELDEAGIEDAPAAEPEAEPAAEDASEPEPDEVQVTIGDDAAPEDEQAGFNGPAPEWVKELREEQRRLRRRVREFEAKEAAAQQERDIAQGVPVLGKKPTLEDHDYDPSAYEAALEAWYRQKESVDEAKRKRDEAVAEERRVWESRLEGYAKQKGALKVRDYDEAEASVQEAFSVTQQGVIIQGAENPALVVYALGKNPKRAKELAAITDPVRFAFAVAKLESSLKISPKSKPPAPERQVPVGTAPSSGAADSTLERLREEAARTGDMTKVVRYKQQLRAKQA